MNPTQYTRNLYGEPIRAPSSRMPRGKASWKHDELGDSGDSASAVLAAGWCPGCHQRRAECECEELERKELDFG